MGGGHVDISILMITYNHEKYIAQAIESVLAQETRLEYELVIGEDCSTDRTREIVLDFQRRYPDKIRLLLRDRNLGMQRNFLDTLRACRGKYIAWLEGDDYWLGTDKLQKQADFLDSHPDYAICFHSVSILNEGHVVEPYLWNELWKKNTFTLEELLVADFIPSCSAMFRNGLTPELPDRFFQLGHSDWPIFVLIARHGLIGYIEGRMAVYRLHAGGVTAQHDDLRRAQFALMLYDFLWPYLEPRYYALVKREKAQRYATLTFAYLDRGDRRNALDALVKCFTLAPLHSTIPLGLAARLLFKLSFPGSYRFFQMLRQSIRR
ncbi:MAG: glycosyltransferase [Anaerolineae bacterium]